MRFRFVLFSLPLFLFLPGCSGVPETDYSSVELIDVSGNVTLDGQPLSGAVVTFTDLQDSTFCFALTDSNGNYVLQFDSVKSGCVPGQKLVEISTSRKILGLNSGEEEGDPDDSGGSEERVPERYNKASELKAEVSASSRTHDFSLTSN